jgi:ketol-acid reductoisomerase
MAKIFYEQDASLEFLEDQSIGIIGYGNQGRAHALNLRDSGLPVAVGTRQEGQSRITAQEDGFPAHTIEEVVANCSLLSIMLPDEAVPEVYEKSIEPYLSARSIFVFAHGFAVRHKIISFPDDADILLVAPTSPGKHVRSLYQEGKGAPALIAVGQDASQLGLKRCLAYAKGIGATRAGAIETSFEQETITNLFCEQAVLCGGIPELIKTSFDTLVERGYQEELAYIFCLQEVKLIADLLAVKGVDGMRAAISNTAKFGSAITGPKIVNAATRKTLEQMLDNIENGSFAKKLLSDTELGSPTIKDLLTSEKHSRIARVGRYLREHLSF